MKMITVRMMVNGKTCAELVDKAEERLSKFLEIPKEELENKVTYEFAMYESSDDGVELSIFAAEVFAKVK
jgi:hypothetical protein